ncbi:MAG: M42 family peptidase [Chloroflexi bacterium]|nr:MAG: M42 family peptidase [Chloroflexota bacterium]
MILQQLSEAIGVSGKEDAVRKIVLKAIEKHVTNIRIDAMGNVTAIKKGTSSDNLRVMIAAHTDEIGFMVTEIDGDGFIKFTNIGSVDERILPGLRVKVGDKQLPGVIMWPPIHKNRDQNAVKLDALRIDIGAKNKDAAKSKVKPGDRIAFDSRFMEVGDKMLRGKAFDDRVGCSLLIDILQGGPYPVDILAAFTVQEEIGLRGAGVAARILNPDMAFALEGTTAHDVPDPTANPDDEDEPNPTARLGDGPALTVIDGGMIADPRLLNFLRSTAESNNIPYQLKTRPGGRTDAAAIHTANAGIPSAAISVPCRYIHSPSAYLNRDDYDNTLKLLQTALNNLSHDVLKRA